MNDHTPVFEPGASYTIDLPEDTAAKIEVMRIQATDADAIENRVLYSIIAGNDDAKFALARDTGELTLATTIDFEKVSSYNLTVMAADVGTPPRNATVEITI